MVCSKRAPSSVKSIQSVLVDPLSATMIIGFRAVLRLFFE